MDLSGLLPRLLEERGWTQERLADAAGLRRTDVNAIIRGRVKVGSVRLARIALALGLTPTDLGADEDEVPVELLRDHDRLERLEAEVATLQRNQQRGTRAVTRRLADLEAALERIERRSGPRSTEAT